MLFAELGAGTVGTAYIGRQLGQGRGWRPLVVRFLSPHLSGRPEVVRVFLDEQRAAAMLQHPRIAAVHEVGVMPDGGYFLATEYVHGVPLREVQRTPQAQLTPAQALHLAMQVCDGLHYSHERLDITGRPLKIVHGQVSPDAVMIGFDGNARLTEFGLLRTRDAATATIPTMLQRRTAFLAPELRAQMPLRAAPAIDRRADVYSVGALLWEMLTGESLVPSEDDKGPPPPSQVRPMEPQLDAIVLRAMARQPGDRYPSAQALRLALSGAQSTIGADGPMATGLARGMTVAFRDRILAFQEQLDLWRKYEDEALPEADDSARYPSGVGMIVSGGGGRRASGYGQGYGSSPPSSPGFSGSPPGQGPSSVSGVMPRPQSGVFTPPSSSTPLPQMTPQPAPAPPGAVLKGRLFLALLLLAIAGILGGGLALVLKPRTPGGAAVLMVDSQPRGAEIRVDGRPAGTTPYRITDLRTPTVRIEVRKDGFRSWSKQVMLEPGKTAQVDAELEPELR